MAVEKGAAKALFWGFIIVGALTIPAFTSGGRSGLTFAGWVKNHTIFGPPVEYVPEEDYEAELEGVERHYLLTEANCLEPEPQ